MTKALIFLQLLVLLMLPKPVHADAGKCMETYYQTKDKHCVDMLVQETSKSGSELKPQEVPINPGILGFFSSIFESDAQEKSRVLSLDTPPVTKVLLAEALYFANFADEAQAYANTNNFPSLINTLHDRHLVALDQIQPNAIPADNDVMIGAYYASGDIGYIKRILANFSSADDGMVRDGLRLSMLQGNFGPNLVPANRSKGLPLQAACQKYACKQDMHNLMRVLTLSSAFWALGSIASHDQPVQIAERELFKNDQRLNQILLEESNAFTNYRTTLVAYSISTANPDLDASLSVFENLGSAQDAAAVLMKKKSQ